MDLKFAHLSEELFSFFFFWKKLSLEKRSTFIISIIFLLAFSIRLTYITTHPIISVQDDEATYDMLAKNLLGGKGYGIYPGDFSPEFRSSGGFGPNIHRPPTYILFLAGIYFLFGHHFIAVAIIQALIDSLTAVIIYLIGKRIFNWYVGMVSGFAMSLYLPMIVCCNHLVTEPFFTFLLAISIFFLIKALEDNSIKGFIFAGTLLGIAILCKSVLALFPFFLFGISIMLFKKLNQKIRKKYIFLLLATTIIIFPWSARNYTVSQKFIPLGTGLGLALWWGNYFPSNAIGPHFHHPALRTLIGEESPFGYGQDKLLLREGIKNIINNPFKFLRLFFIKITRLWWAYDYSPGQESFQIFFLFQNILIMLGILGLLYSLVHWNKCFPLILPLISILCYFTLTYAILHSVKRYILPVMPYVIIFASYGFFTSWVTIKSCLVPRICGRKGLL